MERLKRSQVARISSIIVEASSSVQELSFVHEGCQLQLERSRAPEVLLIALDEVLQRETDFEVACEEKDRSYYHGIKYEDAKQRLMVKVRDACRGLRELGYPLSHSRNPAREEEKVREGEGIGDEMEQFARCLEQLHVYLAHDLSKTSEQKDLSEKHERRVMERTEAAEAEAKYISEQLLDVRSEREIQGRRNTQKIFSLEAEIDVLGKKLRKEREDIFSKSKRTLLEGEALMAQKRSETEESFEKAKEARNALRDAATDEEEHLHRKIKVATRKVNEWIQKYDEDMTRKFARYRRLQKLHEEEIERLAELQEYYRRIDRDLANEREEERLIAEELAEIAAEKAALDNAAARIQSRFRGVLTRKKLKKKKKKKGKGKGKGKGKKRK